MTDISSQVVRTTVLWYLIVEPIASCSGSSWTPICSACLTRSPSSGQVTTRACCTSSPTKMAASSLFGPLMWVTSLRSQGSNTPWGLCTQHLLTRLFGFMCPQIHLRPSVPEGTTTC
ncbi:F-box and WD-40 domain protein 9, isoform CRA_c [Rattus norvegicus]|uniref:F-box and WD-40 domain protein 9, isoform CRA_c n=1 Tax=Rattus norvegicus TaxID=10116 RepID=A6IY34_RAT|nr:F-box and WD-40 domain protein 9, isoform CRA_c [Rattus norvegicus]